MTRNILHKMEGLLRGFGQFTSLPVGALGKGAQFALLLVKIQLLKKLFKKFRGHFEVGLGIQAWYIYIIVLFKYLLLNTTTTYIPTIYIYIYTHYRMTGPSQIF